LSKIAYNSTCSTVINNTNKELKMDDTTNNRSAGQFAWAARMNAVGTSNMHKQNYSQAQQLKAEQMRLALELIYYHKQVHKTFRKTKIAIKVENARVADKKMLAELDAHWKAEGITTQKTPQGIIYSIKKEK